MRTVAPDDYTEHVTIESREVRSILNYALVSDDHGSPSTGSAKDVLAIVHKVTVRIWSIRCT